MPVARNVWQQVEQGSSAAAARRFTMRKTAVVGIGVFRMRFSGKRGV